jgi:hypothetical protein
MDQVLEFQISSYILDIGLVIEEQDLWHHMVNHYCSLSQHHYLESGMKDPYL